MSIFSTILEKIGLKKSDSTASTSAAPAAAAAHTPAASTGVAGGAKSMPGSMTKSDMESPSMTKMSAVDVVAHLEKLAAANPAKLSWKVSIVDLLKLLDMDSSGEARKELATELGCPADMMHDSAKMNTWLHKTVLQKIADNGGNIPQDLLK